MYNFSSDSIISSTERKIQGKDYYVDYSYITSSRVEFRKYKQILKDYRSHPINPPLSYDHRLERLYDLHRMIHVDHTKRDHEEILLRKIGVGLGFHPENVKYIVDKALTLVANGVDLETFIYEIRHMNE